jgi:hypothetical protein
MVFAHSEYENDWVVFLRIFNYSRKTGNGKNR